MKHNIVYCLLFTLCALPGLLPCMAIAKQSAAVFSAYPDAKVRSSLSQDYEQYRFFLTADVAAADATITTAGSLQQHFYMINNSSSLQLFQNYLVAAEQAGFQVVFQCHTEQCGAASQARALGNALSAENSVYNYYRNPYYLLVKRDSEQGALYAAWFIGAFKDDVAVQQVVLQEKPLRTGLITVNLAGLADAATELEPTEQASASELANDHPLLARYPGAKRRKHQFVDTEAFTLPFAPGTAASEPLALVGDLGRHFYVIENASSLKVAENYRSALADAGFQLLSECALQQCGNEKELRAFAGNLSVDNSVYNYYRNPYYLLASKTLDSSEVHVAVFIGAHQDTVAVQQVVIQSKALQTDLITVNADSLLQQLEAEGKALIYGIYFDTGQAEVKAESQATLQVIAQLLQQNPDLNLYVVGHTDDTGSNQLNQTLSKRRADAVVTQLTAQYKITASRLQAEGVGPFAPVSNNSSEAGKQLNRRVELVKRL